MKRRELNRITNKRLMILVNQGYIKIEGVMHYSVEYAANKCIQYDGSNPELKNQLAACKILYSNDTELQRVKNLLINIGLHPTDSKFIKI